MAQRRHWRQGAGDALLALAIATVMTLAWTWRDWASLSVLNLPDTDDVMRLQQIRDWLGGQDFKDLSQHRLGPEGLAMHWSRLPDLVPAALIRGLAPQLGLAGATVAAVILWPGLLFAGALWLIASIATRLDPASGRTAMLVAAVAYPVTTLFMPGRIDHHGLQIVLMLLICRLLLSPGQIGGIVIGVAAAASIVIGLETAPFLLIAGAVLWIGWTRGGPNARMLGLGLGFGLSLAFASIVFAPDAWRYPACDGFTRDAWMSAQLAGFAPVLLGLIGSATASPRHRMGASGLIALGTAAALSLTGRGCLAPYAGLDPMLAGLWLGHVGEAQPMLAALPAVAIGYAGVMMAGIIASLWCWNRRPRDPWGVILPFQIASLALSLMQLRGAYLGAILAAPALAVVIGWARARGGGTLAAAWIGSAGIVYPIAAQALPLPPSAAAPARHRAPAGALGTGANCTSAALMRRLATLPTGTILAPVDLGAYAIAATPHRLIAAPYHRNNRGNAAMYRFFLGPSDAGLAIARRLGADYVVLCADSFAELGDSIADDRARLIGQLRAGAAPAWLRPIDDTGAGSARIFRVEGRLSPAPLPH